MNTQDKEKDSKDIFTKIGELVGKEGTKNMYEKIKELAEKEGYQLITNKTRYSGIKCTEGCTKNGCTHQKLRS